MRGPITALRYTLARLRCDTRGVAAVEFALVVSMLTLGLLNAVDVGYYMFTRMEVENAAEMGGQAAWKTCDVNSLPATTKCAGLTAAITAAIHATSLGAAVSLQSGSPSEGYYCVDAASALQPVGSLASKPANCAAVGNASGQPGDYIQVAVTYTYAPLFPGVSVMSAAGVTAIGTTSWMRLG
jgi:Flp pilus assembly protein TadG